MKTEQARRTEILRAAALIYVPAFVRTLHGIHNACAASTMAAPIFSSARIYVTIDVRAVTAPAMVDTAVVTVFRSAELPPRAIAIPDATPVMTSHSLRLGSF